MLEFLLPEHALTTLAPKPFSSCVHVHVCVRKFNPTAAYKNSFILKCWIICQHLGIWQYLGSRFHLSEADGLCCLSRWVRTSAKPVWVWGTGIYFASPEIKAQEESPWLQATSRELRHVRSQFCSAVVFPMKGGKTEHFFCLFICFTPAILGGGFRVFAGRAHLEITVSGWRLTKYVQRAVIRASIREGIIFSGRSSATSCLHCGYSTDCEKNKIPAAVFMRSLL